MDINKILYLVRDNQKNVLEASFMDREGVASYIGMNPMLLPIYIADSNRVFNGKSIVTARYHLK